MTQSGFMHEDYQVVAYLIVFYIPVEEMQINLSA